MRIGMGLIKNEHGVWHVRKKVPKALGAATATVIGASKPRVSWLKETLRTKDQKQAKIRAKPVMMKFDRVLAQAEALLAERPLRTSLSEKEIQQIADYLYAHELGADEELREGGIGSDPLFADIHRQLTEAGIEFDTPFDPHTKNGSGLSPRMMHKIEESVSIVLPAAQRALARGDIDFIKYELNELLQVFRINLDPNCPDYRKLALAVTKANVRALKDIAARNRGEPIDTPKLLEPSTHPTVRSEGLDAAYDGWLKAKKRSASAIREFAHAIARFKELHGDVAITQITRRHVREFREALQLIPKRRAGKFKEATLPELVEWTRQHPEAEPISPATVNKLLGGVQAVLVWARDNGMIPDEMPWADPFSNMRLEEPRSSREPWGPSELQLLFGSPVFTQEMRPVAGRGEAAFWLPLLALYTGARLNELAPLTVRDVKCDETTSLHYLTVVEDLDNGRSVKTEGSLRAVPIHPELIRVGFLEFVAHRQAEDGDDTPLFPLLERGPNGGFGEAWSKWFGRYKRALGITNPDSVFHSFRHGFKDALRAARVSEDVNDALTGHLGGNRVARGYGAKEMLRRFGLAVLHEAVAKVSYPGLDLSPVRWSARKQ
jgi:integrase